MRIPSLCIRCGLPALLSLLLLACGSTSFLSVAPRQPNGPWVNGHPTSFIRHPDSVQVRTGFIRSEPTELVFETEITNTSDRPVLVAPETFYLLLLPPDSTAEAAMAKGIFASRVPALDPEVQLQGLRAKLDKEADKATGVSWFEILTSATHIAEDVASINKKETAEQAAERDYRHQSDEAYFDEQREHHAQKADYLYSQHENLSSVVLRKTTLEPGQRVRGHVYFPRKDYAKRLRLVVFFDERPVQFEYTQTMQQQ
ncbi:hypothetical protein [Hymenobacter glacieicola]|uniref:Uncharacterized protein n=1 Tax=Hymenobacter glacieicola TaxID=1562124 RepID=A0ABQ1WWZ8_9BACT|nr:hypothetical protein [Hymenobacter glacieicola]GGG48493.1 hypothetical protein GCM10011378_25780 [Hymenobacter glacieicola]